MHSKNLRPQKCFHNDYSIQYQGGTLLNNLGATIAYEKRQAQRLALQ